VKTLDRIKTALRDSVQQLSETDEPLTDDTELLVSGLLDSIAVTQVVATIEACLNREVPALDVTIDNFATLRAMFDYVATRLEPS
jgi:acyl carrier protein